jgi:hypothetical protein
MVKRVPKCRAGLRSAMPDLPAALILYLQAIAFRGEFIYNLTKENDDNEKFGW